jgi:hypothetical protein
LLLISLDSLLSRRMTGKVSHHIRKYLQPSLTHPAMHA